MQLGGGLEAVVMPLYAAGPVGWCRRGLPVHNHHHVPLLSCLVLSLGKMALGRSEPGVPHPQLSSETLQALLPLKQLRGTSAQDRTGA